MKLFTVTKRDAHLSEDKLYRYWLSREIAPTVGQATMPIGRLVWIMLNPSTADALVDDATIRRCMGFGFLWGFREIVVVNLFAFRATNPKALYRVADPVGPENDRWIDHWTKDAREVVAAWSNHGWHMNRDAMVLTKSGAPKHPVRLSNGVKREEIVA
jgi:hypothetical protein